jgi:hypothetical protein
VQQNQRAQAQAERQLGRINETRLVVDHHQSPLGRRPLAAGALLVGWRRRRLLDRVGLVVAVGGWRVEGAPVRAEHQVGESEQNWKQEVIGQLLAAYFGEQQRAEHYERDGQGERQLGHDDVNMAGRAEVWARITAEGTATGADGSVSSGAGLRRAFG